MSELGNQLRNEEVKRILEESVPKPSEPVKIETEGVFNQDYLEEPDPDSFQDNPMKTLAKMMADLKSMMTVRPALADFARPKLEHTVRIFRFNERTIPAEIITEVETLLNDGWYCNFPIVCADLVMMPFQRRKESENAD